MRAVVLAAGKGNRLRPLTDSLPKPLLPLGGSSILGHNLALLASAGVTHAAINLHHHGEAIRKVVGDGKEFGLAVSYSDEPELLGTAGGTRQAASLLPDTWPLLVLYGDNLIEVNLGRMESRHRETGGVATIALYRLSDVRNSGVANFDESGRIKGFVEKPQVPAGKRGWVNAGLYLLEKAAMDAIPVSGYSDFGYDIFPRLLAEGHSLFSYCLSEKETVYPIDTPGRYQRAAALLGKRTREPRPEAAH